MRRTTIIKIFLAGSAIVLLACLLTFSLKYQITTDTPQKQSTPDETDAELSINRFHHTATREGKTQWTLNAASAEFFSDSNRVRLTDLSVVFLPHSPQSKTNLTADSGVLDVNTHDMSISGNIIVKNRQYQLKTESLHYSHESHIISTNKPVDIAGPAVQLRADTMTVDLTDGHMECKGHVKGTIIVSESFQTID